MSRTEQGIAGARKTFACYIYSRCHGIYFCTRHLPFFFFFLLFFCIPNRFILCCCCAPASESRTTKNQKKNLGIKVLLLTKYNNRPWSSCPFSTFSGDHTSDLCPISTSPGTKQERIFFLIASKCSSFGAKLWRHVSVYVWMNRNDSAVTFKMVVIVMHFISMSFLNRCFTSFESHSCRIDDSNTIYFLKFRLVFSCLILTLPTALMLFCGIKNVDETKSETIHKSVCIQEICSWKNPFVYNSSTTDTIY